MTEKCPNCGYCPSCGRANARYPYSIWVYDPWFPYGRTVTTPSPYTQSPNISISDTSTSTIPNVSVTYASTN